MEKSHAFQTHASLYVARGLMVLPMVAGQKRPLTPNGYKDASNDPKQIVEWAKQFPHANIAIAAGPNSGARGCCIIDVDKHNDGFVTMAALLKRHGPLPKGPRGSTPRGGVHLYFQHEPGIVQGNDKLGKGVDVKTKNGGAVAAPSYWDGTKKGEVILPGGGFYKWIVAPQGSHFPKMPDWMVKMLTPVPTDHRPAYLDGSNPTTSQLMDLLRYVPNTDYDLWIRVGMGLKAALGDEGFPVWDQWSASGYGDYDPKETLSRWRSFKRSTGISIGSIVWHAQQGGAPVREIMKEKIAASG